MRLARVANEVKERFATARLLVYEACHAPVEVRGIDKLTAYADNLDYAAYGVGVGKLKVGYEATFNILDKIAFFVNDYLSLGIPENEVSFARLWKQRAGKGHSTSVRQEIRARNNPHLYGLYDISRDLAASGMSRELGLTRHFSTHRYLVPHIDKLAWGEDADGADYHIGYRALLDRTIALMQLVRSAIIYLLALIALEERRKFKAMGLINVPILHVGRASPIVIGPQDAHA